MSWGEAFGGRKTGSRVRHDSGVERTRPHRIAQAVGLVGTWILIGFGLNRNANVYLLVGIPLIAAFQLRVRRQPLRALWVRASPGVASAPHWRLLVAVSAIPGLAYLVPWAIQGHLGDIGIGLAAVLGAVGVGYAFVSANRSTGAQVLGCLATTGVLGVLVFLQIGYTHGFGTTGTLDKVGTGLGNFAFMVPLGFIVEEVAFRGAIDSHVHHPGESRGLASALLVALLWGAWHFPLDQHWTLITGPWGLDGLAGNLLYQGVLGVAYSLWWRKSGNLLVTSITHAATDAFRNALFL